MRVLLLGMNNPLSDEPQFDLFPYPSGSTGWRLWKMLPEGTSRREYLQAFDRLNLLRARDWSPREARQAARDLLPALCGREIVVLGTAVRTALGLPPAEPLTPCWAELEGDCCFYWWAFPHPSGRNRWFNDEENYAAACHLLQYLMSVSEPEHSGTAYDFLAGDVPIYPSNGEGR